MRWGEEWQKLSREDKEAAKERDDRLKKSLLDFVESGKGIVGIHAAVAVKGKLGRRRQGADESHDDQRDGGRRQ